MWPRRGWRDLTLYEASKVADPPSNKKLARSLDGVFGTTLNLCQNVAQTQSYSALDLNRTGLT